MATRRKDSTSLLRSAAERAAAMLSQRARRMSGGGIRSVEISWLEPSLALAFELGAQWQERRK